MSRNRAPGAVSFPALVVFLLSGCGDPPPDGEPRDALWGDSLVLVEEMRLGGIEGDERHTFGYVAAIAPAPDGTFFVADAQVPVIRRYSADGEHLLDIGSRGEGPGEILGVQGMGVLPDDRLVVFDASNARVTSWTLDGEFLESTMIPTGGSSFRGFVYGENGRVFLSTVEIPSGPLAGGSDLQRHWSEVLPDGSVEVVHPMPATEPSEGPQYVLAGRGGYYRPFNTETLITLGPDGALYQVRNDEYRIRRTAEDGSTHEIVRDEPPVAVTGDERREWEVRSEGFAEQTPDARDRYFPIPRTKPFIRELVTDPAGRLWVSRYTEATYMPYTEAEIEDREDLGLTATYNWRDLPTWDVFSPEGELLGVVHLPFKTTFSVAVGDHVWGIQSGDYREDWVVRWRIEPFEDP